MKEKSMITTRVMMSLFWSEMTGVTELLGGGLRKFLSYAYPEALESEEAFRLWMTEPNGKERGVEALENFLSLTPEEQKEFLSWCFLQVRRFIRHMPDHQFANMAENFPNFFDVSDFQEGSDFTDKQKFVGKQLSAQLEYFCLDNITDFLAPIREIVEGHKEKAA